MAEDVVAELDRWLRVYHFAGLIDVAVMQRARDEIVGLRKLTDGDWVWKQITGTRDEALEEAARLCDRIGLDGFASDGAAAIRALKEKH